MNDKDLNFEKISEQLFTKTIDENGKEVLKLTKFGYLAITFTALSVIHYILKLFKIKKNSHKGGNNND